ncbi:hypothetical protein ES703_78770 [subsurface metagenome]
MGVLALVLSIIGGLCTIMSIITAAEAIPMVFVGFTGIYWLGLAGVLLVAAITCLVARGGYE